MVVLNLYEGSILFSIHEYLSEKNVISVEYKNNLSLKIRKGDGTDKQLIWGQIELRIKSKLILEIKVEIFRIKN